MYKNRKWSEKKVQSSEGGLWIARQKGGRKVRKTAVADPILACLPRFCINTGACTADDGYN